MRKLEIMLDCGDATCDDCEHCLERDSAGDDFVDNDSDYVCDLFHVPLDGDDDPQRSDDCLAHDTDE